MKSRRNLYLRLVLGSLATAGLLAACGGDDFQNPPATSQVPASASASIDGFIAYLKQLVATDPTVADTLEPVDTSMVTPPVDETSEPQAVP
jgi:hypothetical protein